MSNKKLPLCTVCGDGLGEYHTLYDGVCGNCLKQNNDRLVKRVDELEEQSQKDAAQMVNVSEGWAEDVTRHRKDNIASNGHIGELRALLRELEWCGPISFTRAGHNLCVICGEVEDNGHKPDCALGNALKENK